jgi:ribosomal protein S1
MTENKNNLAVREKLITYADFADDVFAGFKNDKERIKYMKRSAYGKMSLTKSFSIFYNIELPNEIKNSRNINRVINIEVGKIYVGTVKEITERYISFEVNGVKNEILCKENFSDCRQHFDNYLLTHDNKMMFEVREFTDGKYIVSILNAYYKKWMESIEQSANGTEGIDVHIDSLVPGGYICHCTIEPLKQITGKTYTSSVFIPGSHIVLNIERDFERWIGKDVTIIPQKFVDFVDTKTGVYNNVVEKSLVGSRKRVLQLIGNQYLYDMYNLHKLNDNDTAKFEKPSYTGTVTGIINSIKKTGVFVELNDKYITGLLPLDSSELLDYKPGDEVVVKIKEFEIQPEKEPFIINKNNKVVKCHTRPVFEIG